jgi:glycosyltransferase involved in cell wall biosynthesis
MKTNLLYISPNFNYACGVSKHVFINLKHLSENPDYALYFITNGGDSLDRLNQKKNLNIKLFNFKKDHKNVFYLIRDSVQLYLFCKKNKINIIHTHHRYAELLSVIVSKIYKLKTITTAHSFVEGLKRISFRSDKIICVSNSVKQHIIKNYPHSKNKLELIYNCIDDDFIASAQVFSSKCPRKINNEYTKILFVGKNNPIKGLDVLIKSIHKLSIHYKLKLIVIGLEKSEILKDQIIYSDNIEFEGVQNNLIKYYQECDIIVIPSRVDSFPYVMLEAAIMQKPIIAGNTGGLGEFISNDIDGILFDVGNADELAKKIEFIIDKYDDALLMAEKLYLKVKEVCNCKLYFEKLHTLYIQFL